MKNRIQISIFSKSNSAIVLLLIVSMLFTTFLMNITPQISYAEVDYSVPPEIEAEAAILINASTGEVLYEKEADMQRAPASTTKIMTSLIAIETLQLDQMVTIDEETEAVNDSQMNLKEGEEISVDHLLYGTLLSSANDGAVALAKTVSGTVSDFVVKMNARAREMGLENTNFMNANGLDDDNHYSTARDMAKLGMEAMKNSKFKEYVSTVEYVIPETNMRAKRNLINSNHLLFDEETQVMVYDTRRPIKYDGTVGVKTGYTSVAGRCLVAMVERDGLNFVAVVMGSPGYTNQVFEDMITLFEYGYANYEQVILFSDENSNTKFKARKAKEEESIAVPFQEVTTTLRIGTSAGITYKFELSEKLVAPLEKGTKVGKVQAYLGDTLLGEVDLIAKDEVEKKPNIFERIASLPVLVKIILVIVLLVVLFFLYVMLRQNRQVSARRKRRRMNWGSGSNTRDITRVKRIK